MDSRFLVLLVSLGFCITILPETFASTELPFITESIGLCNSSCVNGVDKDECTDEDGYACACAFNGTAFFWGNLCEHVNLSVPSVETTKRTVQFIWRYPPLIKTELYSFAYNEENAGDVIAAPFTMINDRTARLIDLTSGRVTYTVCVYTKVHASAVAEFDNVTEIDSQKDECVRIITDKNLHREYTIAAIVAATFVCVTVVALIIVQMVSSLLDERRKRNLVKPRPLKDEKIEQNHLECITEEDEACYAEDYDTKDHVKDKYHLKDKDKKKLIVDAETDEPAADYDFI